MTRPKAPATTRPNKPAPTDQSISLHDALTATADQLHQAHAQTEQRLDAARARVLRLKGQLDEAEEALHRAMHEYARTIGAAELTQQIRASLQPAE